MVTTSDEHDWLTLHRVRLKEARDGTGNPMPGPDGVLYWRFYPDSSLGESGMRTNNSAIWGGFAIHPSRDAAEAFLVDGDAAFPFADDIAESWRALAIPIRHYGTVNWRDEVLTDTTLRAAQEDPGGPLVVLTSAGYNNPGPSELPRISKFLQQVEAVRAEYSARPENIRVAVFSGAGVDGHDGITMTIWRDLPAMMGTAYKAGAHRGYMDGHKAHPAFDRSSFTRLRVLDSSGSWDGDPLEGLT